VVPPTVVALKFCSTQLAISLAVEDPPPPNPPPPPKPPRPSPPPAMK
jgi:hypothetical protein